MGNAKPLARAARRIASPARTVRSGHVEGMPLGTRGGLLVEHLFPADGEYVFNINQSGGGGGGYVAGLDTRHKMIMTIDGKKVFEQEARGRRRSEVRRSEAGAGGEGDSRSFREHQGQRAWRVLTRLA